ncbi:hypothetical protein ACH47C_33680 [Streptomyces rishiriensis]|uniref:hypothetical protein n=1 Tax=Streptomyces rishiriensis TaxID=68264 RepID=UPI0033E2A6A9
MHEPSEPRQSSLAREPVDRYVPAGCIGDGVGLVALGDSCRAGQETGGVVVAEQRCDGNRSDVAFPKC